MATPEGVTQPDDMTLSPGQAADMDAALSDEGKTVLPEAAAAMDDIGSTGLDGQYGEGNRPTPEDDRDGIEYILQLEHDLNTKSRRLFDTQCLVAAILKVKGECRLPKEVLADADPSEVVITSGFDGAVTFSLKEPNREA